MFRLNLLGTVDLSGAEGVAREASLRHSKRVALLAYLVAARPRGFHRREKIAALFWPELPGDRARAALRTTLSRLREEYHAEMILVRGADEIAVNTAMLGCDVVDFDDAIAARRFAETASLYRGPLLDGVHVEGTGEELEHWIESERARLHTAAVRALCSTADEAAQRGALGVATEAAQRAVALAPTDEIAARQLISLALAAGNRGGAMQIYDNLARRLRSDFDVEPSHETRAALNVAAPATSPSAEPVPALAQSERGQLAAPAVARSRWRVRGAAAVAVTLVVIVGAWAIMRIAPAAPRPAVATARSTEYRWRRLTASFEGAPTPRTLPAVMLDSTNDGLIVIGGIVARGEGAEASPVVGDVWRLTGLQLEGGHQWRQLHPAPGPAPRPRWNAMFAYDPAHDRALLIAGATGHSSPCLNDAWVLDRASGIGGAPRWRVVGTTGPRPSTRAQAQGAYDARTRTLILFGGNDCFATYMADVWTLRFDDSTLTTGRWTQLEPDSSAGAPLPRNAAGVAYDARNRRLWVQGGNLGGSQVLSELWRLDHADGLDGTSSWHPVRCAGAAPAISNQVAAYDTTSGTLLLFSGMDDTGRSRNDLWYARGLADGGSHCRWEHVVPMGDAPLPRESARAVFIPATPSMIVLGGTIESFAVMDLWRLDQPFR